MKLPEIINRTLRRGKSSIVSSIVLACTLFVAAGAAQAQQYPNRPIRILVGYGAGGATDMLARLYASKLTEILNTSVLVENRPGSSELIAATPVMNGAPDGYVLWLGTGGALAQSPGIRRDLPYEMPKSFTPVALISEAESVIVIRPGVPVNSFAELIAYGKANPGKLNYGSGGVGSGNHLVMEYMLSVTGASITHIPYKSEPEIVQGVIAGSVDVTMLTGGVAVPLLADGRLKAMAVTGSQRLKPLPNVPAVPETGVAELKAMGSYTFFGLMAPPNMPAALTQQINDAVNKVSAMPDIDARLRDVLLQRPRSTTPAEFKQFLEREVGKWRELSKTVKISIN